MTRRKRSRASGKNGSDPLAFFTAPAFRYLLAGIAAAAVVFFAARQAAQALFDSPYFKIKTIEIDRTLGFLDKRDFTSLNGKSIFSVDVVRFQRSLTSKYPQMAQANMVKKFPDKILVLARKRPPFAQVNIQNKTVLIDDQGVVLFATPEKGEEFPLISGIVSRRMIMAGSVLGGESTRLALEIVKTFQNNNTLSAYRVAKISVDDLKEIDFQLSNGLKIIVDKTDIERKIDTLALVLARNRMNTEQVKYIDLRFKDPILGTK
jgi:cell division septal protein FtsQ